MLCLNNFVIIGVTDDSTDLASKLWNLTGLKVWEVFSNAVKVLVGVQSENCTIEGKDLVLLLHGIFLGETPLSLLDKKADDFEAFSKKYKHQGVLVLIDKERRIIRVLGDPLGTRIVFYSINPKAFIISTDMKLLRSTIQALDGQLERDVLALYEIMNLGYIVSRRSIFKNVSRLLPGEGIAIRVSKNTFEYNVIRYWNIMPINMSCGNKDVVVQLLKYVVDQLNSYCKETLGLEIAVPISGGIDSSLLLLLASKSQECRQIRAIHVNIENRMELLLSNLISIKVGVPIYIVTFLLSQLKEEYIQTLDRILKIIGYPREGDASLPYLVLAQHMRDKGIKFSIGGDDADSIFGGYDYHKFFATQLILEKRILEFLKLVKILREYNYSLEKLSSIVLKTLFQLILRSYSLRYRYFKSRLYKFSQARSKRLKELIAQYLAELSSVLYNASVHNYYYEILGKVLVHKASHLVHTRVKAEESQGIITFLPYASREIIELIMQIPPEYFFLPIGSRSLPRLLLKSLDTPPIIYLQPKSGFDITAYILRDPEILSYMKKSINNCWVAKYIKTDRLTPTQIHALLNICLVSD